MNKVDVRIYTSRGSAYVVCGLSNRLFKICCVYTKQETELVVGLRKRSVGK